MASWRDNSLAHIMTPRDLESACSPPTIPHIEGERNPLKRFAASLASATPFSRPHYYRDNFADLMGGELAVDLRLSHCGEMVPRGPRCMPPALSISWSSWRLLPSSGK
jgi:hypothetical protein